MKNQSLITLLERTIEMFNFVEMGGDSFRC